MPAENATDYLIHLRDTGKITLTQETVGCQIVCQIEDTDRRVLPLTDEAVAMLADDLIDRARAAMSTGIGQNLACTWRAPTFLNK